MQAQEPFDPYTAMWSRLEGFRPEELSDLIESKQAVRAPSMLRTTIHLLTARDWLALRPVVQVVQEQGFRGSPFNRNLVGLDLDEVVAEGRRILDEKPRSGNELGKALAERWPDRDVSSLGYAVRSLLPIVQLPPRGLWRRSGRPVLATAEYWLGESVGTDDTPDDMILRYLAAFGPAIRDGRPGVVLADEARRGVRAAAAEAADVPRPRTAGSCSTCPTGRCPIPTRRRRSASSRPTTTSSSGTRIASRLLHDEAPWGGDPAAVRRLPMGLVRGRRLHRRRLEPRQRQERRAVDDRRDAGRATPRRVDA